MNIQPLFEIQRKFNDSSIINDELDAYKLQARKHLEFEVKLGDLANETNCFNYLKGNIRDINIDIVFEKYISCVSQILTLGLDNSYTDLISVTARPNDYCLSDQFLNLYFDINDLISSPSLDHYITLFEDILSLGLTFGFSEKQIENQFNNGFYKKAAL